MPAFSVEHTEVSQMCLSYLVVAEEPICVTLFTHAQGIRTVITICYYGKQLLVSAVA